MAQIYQKSGAWYVRYKDADGKRVAKKTKARSKAEATKLGVEIEMRVERQVLGLELRNNEGAGTVYELMMWWLETFSVSSVSHERNVSQIERHFADSEIGKVSIARLNTAHVERYLHEKAKTLAPQTVNHLRRFLVSTFNCARRVGKYIGANPVLDVRKRRVPKKLPDYLRQHEVQPVLDALKGQHRALFATAIYTGMRKGELFALRKTDVDMRTGLLTIARSHDRDTTKGGHVDVIPIAEELIPYLQHSMNASACELVFPDQDGKQWRHDTDLANVLRAALKRAGITLGYEHVCRRRGCGHKETHADAALRLCPKDERKLWPKAKVRQIRFHDLRHTTASLLMMSGANPAATQRIMRHSDPRITTEIYGHLSPDYLRAEINKLSFTKGTSEAPGRKNLPSPKNRASQVPEFEEEKMARGTGVEPVTFGFGERFGGICRGYQGVASC